MVFSSPVFLFFFLPVVLVLYFLPLLKKYRNFILLISSLLFYAYGEPKFVFLMIAVVLLDYLLALLAYSYKESERKLRLLVVLTVISNLALLGIFKYTNFITLNLNQVGFENVTPTQISLPIGISFFLFQAMSYVFDVSRGVAVLQKNPLNVLLYVCLFPQLVAGPIVRYQTVADEINRRSVKLNEFVEGCERFIFGLAKKCIFANTFGVTADYCFGLVGNTGIGSDAFSIYIAWLGAISYTLQIYFDFSGYSDMAIGLGLMFGFHFEENFNYPYMSRSISEFWRRWHISMGTWFRDYVYFPLGGSRMPSLMGVVRNLIIVWLLTGIWHGANWTFILWGIWQLIWIVFEKVTGFPEKSNNGKLKILYRCLVLLLIVIGWVLFRSESVESALEYLGVMFTIPDRKINGSELFILKDIFLLMTVGIILSTDYPKKIISKYKNTVLYRSALIFVFLLSVAFSITTAYDPFIYFNF